MSYTAVIQRTIEYIETNLHEELSLERIAQFIGFSKYHYHRIFQKEVGVTLSEYIRYRRIANAANILLYTDEKIIDIAVHYRFETQESFTRAFKKHYHLPPGQYRTIIGSLTRQKEETKMKQEEAIKGWFLSGTHPFNYAMELDRKTFHKGKASGLLKSVTVEGLDEFATMMQQFKADKHLGKRIKLSGFLKTAGVSGFSGFWMRIDNNLGDIVQFDNMSNRPVTGDSEWNHYAIVLDVPDNSAVVSFGVILSGRGRVWVDELRFEEVDDSIAVTNLDYSQDLLDEPVNLSFEE
ncbi:transcriptional regulator [Paenibacillus sp. FSL R7-0273]|uniref:helix-turn-helix transcriptional regulator n=1 Tax=Paenibacillus sp. FSL R7-0273 TaxID=1536772 RepID=UPI0004F91C1D|nr:AraC family transcriptional regulator [Paenibacillus sp. FSL R7-0273]AIQ44778.1 transcriptional regulator [Paenibacillus sp. FSL R7-0273]OMF93359.1 AraC family transcriptional regulator [Paenibacillus sp. FSL R7-0273]